jgi:hypothetical protein
MSGFYTKAIRYLAYHHNELPENELFKYNEVFKYHVLQFVSEEPDMCTATVGSTNDQTVIITIIMLMLALNIDKPLYVHTTCDGETLIADMFHEYEDIPVNYKFPLPYKLGIITIVRRINGFVVPDADLFEKLMNKTPDDIIEFVANIMLTSEMFGVSNIEYRNIVLKRLNQFNQNSKAGDISL